jgi:outer membrane protein assembly factor BamA
MRRLRPYICVLVCFFFQLPAFSQQSTNPSATTNEIKQPDQSTPFTVRNIVITGNKKTKEIIILRELPFKSHDQLLLPQLVAKFDDARKQLMNTTLFHEVTVSLKSVEEYNVDILIAVKERWYLFPVPYFKFVDRNLNQWLVQNKASLSRVNYGAKVIYHNATGHRDKLNLWLMNGYTKQISLSYDRLYFDRQLKWGARIGVAMGKNHEVSYNTINNKEVFLKDTNNYIRNFLRTSLELTYRPAIKTRHRFGIAYTVEQVEDTIVKLNPDYFTMERTRIRFPEIYYTVTYSNVDYIPYPLKGFETQVSIGKKGFNSIVNVWELSVYTGNYWEVMPKWYFSVNTMGTLKLPLKQPFFNTKLMGYGEMFMQGYEYYVVDGVAGGFVQTNFSRALFDFRIPLPKSKRRTMNYLPFKFYGKIYANTGYVYNPNPGNNQLNNRMLYSGGIGLDILTAYDLNLRLEWSFNQLGENGVYLHKKKYF